MHGTLDIAIVGYGTAGQAAARLLAAQGHRLELFERAPQPRPVGAGLLLQPTGLCVLAELGLLDAALDCGEPIHTLLGETITGRRVIDMAYADLGAGWFGLGLQRGALFELLRAPALEARLCSGSGIVAVDTQRGELTDDAGRRHGRYDLVLICGGAASTLRPAGLVKRDRPYPWGALWCLCADPQRRYSGQLQQRYAGPRRMAGLLPVGVLPQQESGSRQVGFFWSLPATELEPALQRGTAAWRAEVARHWPAVAPLLESIVDTSQLRPALYRDAVLRRFHSGRVAWLGDAAHAMSPQLGQGANLALLDASALARTLRQHPDLSTALAAYDRERRSHVGIYQFVSRWLTPLFQSELDWAGRLRDLCFGPLARLPLARGETLKVLAGIKRGLFGRVALAPPLLRTTATTKASGRAGLCVQPQDSGGT